MALPRGRRPEPDLRFFGKRRETVPAEAPPPATVLLHARALEALLERLVPGGAYQVLDLGPAIGANIALLSERVQAVRVADLHGSLGSVTGAARRRVLDAALAEMAPPPGAPLYHAVLAWDLLNYLEPEELETVGHRMAELVRPGGRIFALVWYTAEMPAAPLAWRIADGGRLVHETAATTRPAPRYPAAVVEAAFGEFETEAAYLLKGGLQEYLLVRKEPAPPPPDP